MKRFSVAVTLLAGACFFGACADESQRKPRTRPGFTPPQDVVVVEETEVVDRPVRETVVEETVETTQTTPTTAPAPRVGNPEYGKPVPGKPGFVTSPYAPADGYVDVRGWPPGTEVKDPYSGKIFLVP